VSATLITKEAGLDPTRDELDERLKAENLSPRWWSNGPGDTYDWHEHPYHKVAYCQFGSIQFHTRNGDFARLVSAVARRLAVTQSRVADAPPATEARYPDDLPMEQIEI
jgi:hypothetical protein